MTLGPSMAWACARRAKASLLALPPPPVAAAAAAAADAAAAALAPLLDAALLPLEVLWCEVLSTVAAEPYCVALLLFLWCAEVWWAEERAGAVRTDTSREGGKRDLAVTEPAPPVSGEATRAADVADATTEATDRSVAEEEEVVVVGVAAAAAAAWAAM